MTNFNKKYFEDIWGSVHRHEYCESLADALIKKYGKVKILDIGTGCGYLVKVLREKGCDAWGMEVSQYAVDNSCDKEHVRFGDVRDIPFASGFDVIFSQGLWEYIPDEDVQKAITECRRVGIHQEHNYDTIGCDNPIEHQKLPLHTTEWWLNQWYPKVLVACPNHELKEYAFQRWIDNVKKFNYPNFDILVVDNSPNEDMFNKYKSQIPMLHREIYIENVGNRIIDSMEVIRQEFLKYEYQFWFNLESDVIPPSNIIEKMLEWRNGADWTAHGYYNRNNNGYEIGIGCSLLSRKMVEENDFLNPNGQHGPDGYYWDKIWKQGYKYKTVELYFFNNVEHLAE